uniref:ADAMTS/ADAMTS-like cysteine-rich domain-containing protein n=2 Tax=Hucho hucho TaxID=62062 RepID=A0A4W5KGC6_9TELE
MCVCLFVFVCVCVRASISCTLTSFPSLSQASRMTGSDEEGDSGWDAWGTWSDCSRTCGGGASYSLRRCLNGGNCEGKNIRYRTCSNMDCPVESGDFRAQQCSAHNDIRYQGMVYEWVPVPYEPSAACALRCQARGRSLTVELAPKVLDGTRCRADALDMCISGVCQEVGCDRQLGSGAREDNCGVCAGDGSTCRLVRGQVLPHVSPEERRYTTSSAMPEKIHSSLSKLTLLLPCINIFTHRGCEHTLC